MAIADSFGTNYLNNIRNINQAFAPIDTNLLQQQLSAGGVGNTLGFGADGINTLGLTPEDIAGLVNMRGVISNQNTGLVRGVTDLNDLLSGNKETRAAMTQANRDIFQASAEEANQERRQDWMGQQYEANREIDRMRAAEEKRYHDLYIGQQKAELGQRAKEHNDMMRLKREEMMAVRDAASAAVGMKDTTGLIAKLGDLKNAASKNNRMDDYFRYHMMESSLTATPGTVFDLKDYKEFGQGYKQLILGPDNNWYGVNPAKNGGRPTFSGKPIVYNPINALSVSSSGSVSKVVPKYQPR